MDLGNVSVMTPMMSRATYLTCVVWSSLAVLCAKPRICFTSPAPRAALLLTVSRILRSRGADRLSRRSGAANMIGARTLLRSWAMPAARDQRAGAAASRLCGGGGARGPGQPDGGTVARSGANRGGGGRRTGADRYRPEPGAGVRAEIGRAH